MIISHTRKFIFLKSVKTAGTSLEAALSQYCSGNDVVTPLNDFAHNRTETGAFIHKSMNADDYRAIGQHVDAQTIRDRISEEQWNSYFKVSIARNPWDRVVSLFSWRARNDHSLQPQQRFYHRLGVPFDAFRETQKRFREFVRSASWETNDKFYILDDHLCVDYLIRYESLTDDFATVCSRLGLPEMQLPRLKAGIRPGKYHYSAYYDEATEQIVADRHLNDLRLLGYRFERA